ANGGNYDVSLPGSGQRLEPLATGAAQAKPAANEEPRRPAPEQPTPTRTPAEEKPAAAATPAAAAPTPRATPAPSALRGRRGPRTGAGGPPPLRPGQVVKIGGDTTPAEAPPVEAPAVEAAPAEEAKA